MRWKVRKPFCFGKYQILNASLFRITATLTSFKRLPIHYYYVEVTYMPRLCNDAEQDLEVETALLCNSDMISTVSTKFN